MKIILKAENKEEEKMIEAKEVEIVNVKRYLLIGMRAEQGIVPQDFHYWSAPSEWLIGQTYSYLKKFENVSTG